MKYAGEVIDLMGAYPGRQFRMGEIVRYVENGKSLDVKQRKVLRESVRRVLTELEGMGSLGVNRTHTNGSFAMYFWKSATSVA